MQVERSPIRVLITGAAGQIGYSIIPLVASGEVFGLDQPLYLHLLEIEPALNSLKGVAMEIEDCAYPLVRGLLLTHKTEEAFKEIDYAILVGGFPRKPGMERKDLMEKNAPIFRAAGQALEKFAKKTTKILVVANPANTNCLVCATHAPSIPRENFCALTRLDMNRAKSQVAMKLNAPVSKVKNIAIWGNHSSTQVPDVNNGLIEIDGALVPVSPLLEDKWVRGEFTQIIQQRGKAILEARGFSSALSAANAIRDCFHNWIFGTPKDEHVAMAVYSDGSYGVAKDLIYSFPCVCQGGRWKIVQNVHISKDVRELMKKTEQELLEEKREAGL